MVKDNPKDAGNPPGTTGDENQAVMLQTALRLGLRDLESVQDYELEMENEEWKKQKAERAKYLIVKKNRNSDGVRSLGAMGYKLPNWRNDPDIPLRADFLKDLSFAECAKTPQGIRMTIACLLHYDEVKRNAALIAKLRALMQKKMDEFVANCYAPIVPLLALPLIRVRRHPVPLNKYGDPKTRMIPFTVLAEENEHVFEATCTQSRPSCYGVCGRRIPKEITVTSSKNQEFVMKLCLSHWNGILPEWVDIIMEKNQRFATIHSTNQVHINVENNYDIFDNHGRVLGVISPETASVTDRINVSLYDVEGASVTARIRKPKNKKGEYTLHSSQDMSPDLKAVSVAVMIFLLVEDLAGYHGRGVHGR